MIMHIQIDGAAASLEKGHRSRLELGLRSTSEKTVPYQRPQQSLGALCIVLQTTSTLPPLSSRGELGALRVVP